MDIYKVQKLNEMAMNLKRHNIVESRETAVASAARIYGEEHNFSDSTISNAFSNNEDKEELRKDVRKLTFALKNAINELNELKAQMGKLDKEVNDMRVNQKPRVVERIVEKPIEQVHITAPVVAARIEEPIQAAEQPKARISKPIDRNGVAPSDVSIDKFFYFGQK